MGSAGGDTPALATNPKFIFFTDFDGTVTTADSNDHMTDNLGFGVERRRWLNKEVLYGRMDFRDSFDEMISSIPTPFDECIEILKRDIKLDPGFKEFYIWAQENNVPIVILSGGMQPVIRALLDTLLGPGWNIQIVSNDVAPREGKSINDKNGWKIQFHDERLVCFFPAIHPMRLAPLTHTHDDSHHGHDKSLEIRKYSSLPNRPTMFYAGDGVSDLSAAKETDLLFAKADKGACSFSRPTSPFSSYRWLLTAIDARPGNLVRERKGALRDLP
jgi:2,3-diketo-5-methylthio-1-phosphopentane phosphatase